MLDNAPSHAGIETHLADDSTLPAHDIIRLPPYSCELNPIENMFNVCKTAAKQALNSVNHIPGGLNETLLAHRFRILKDIVKDSLQVITPAKVNGSFLHCLTKVTRKALNYEDM